MRNSHRIAAGRGAALALRCAAIVLLQVGVSSASLGAQQTTGRLVGRVLDAQSGQGVVGAAVMIEGTGIGTVSGIDGRYLLPRVPAGVVALRVENLGFATKTVTGVQVPASGGVELNVTLEQQAIELEGLSVTVSAERGSVNRALDEQRTSLNIVNAISAEQMERSPDGDAAAAVQRVSGVTVQDGKFIFVRGMGERYTTTALNGARVPSPEPERKVIPLDLFPAGLLQTITTAKTFTPDLPGDFAGAHVNIRTREFPAQRRISGSLSFGYNDAITGNRLAFAPRAGGESFALVNGERAVPGSVANAGGFGGVTQDQINTMVREFRNAWTVRPGSGRPNTSASLSVGGSDPVFGLPIGYLATGSYSYAEEGRTAESRASFNATDGSAENVFVSLLGTGRHSAQWGGLLNLSTTIAQTNRISFNNVYNRTGENEGRLERGFSENLALDLDIERLRYVERSIRSNQLLGEHVINGSQELEWSLTSNGVTRAEPDRSEIIYALQSDAEGNVSRQWLGSGTEAAVRTFGALDEHSWEGALNYRFTFGNPARPHGIKVGGMYRATERDAENRAYSITNQGTPLTSAERSLPAEQIFDGRFAQPGDNYLRVAPLLAGGSYSASDRLSAGYLMGELWLASRLQLVGGLRVENSEVRVDALSQDGSPARSDPQYTDLLPALSLNVDLTDAQKLRLSASRTVARPEYRELVPYLIRDVLGSDNIQGFPGLKRTTILNADARWEWYPAPGEVLSLGVFGKRFDDPIERVYLGTSGTLIVTFRNPERAVNYGAEFELRKRLDTFSEALTSFTAFTNVTLMHSRIEVGDTLRLNEDRALIGQAPYVVNAGLTYAPEEGRTSATLLYNVVGERIYTVGALGLPDVVEEPRHMLDFSLRRDLGKSLSAKLDVRNILDEPFVARQGDVVRETYNGGRVYSLGISWQPTS